MGKSKEIAELGAVFTQDGGNVGIGTASPTDKLHIKSGGNAYRMLFLEAESGSGDSGILLQGDGGHQFSIQQPGGSQGLFFYDRTNTAYRMYIDSSGNIGIGTTTPDLVGSTTTLTLNHSGGNGQLSLMGNGTVYGRIFADNATGDLKMGNPTSNDVMFYTGNLEVMRITSDRTTKLSTAQNMGGATSFPSWSGEGGYLKGYFNGGGSGPYNRYLDVAALGDSSWGGIMRFITNPDSSSTGQERMRIAETGYVGINYTDPSRRLYVASNDSTTGGNVAAFRNNNSTAGAFINFIAGGNNAPAVGAKGNDLVFTDDGYSGNEHLRLTSSGDLKLKSTDTPGITYGVSPYLEFRAGQTNGQNVSLAKMRGFSPGNWGGDLIVETKPANGQVNDTTVERMRIDSSGRVTKPYQPAFLCRPPAAHSIIAGEHTVTGTWSSEYNIGNHFNTSNGQFTAPVAGVYAFSWAIFASGSLGTRSDAWIAVNGTPKLRIEIGSYNSGTTNRNQHVHGQLKISANDVVTFGTYQNNNCTIYSTVSPWSYAAGYLLG